jgi:hypothetical protein
MRDRRTKVRHRRVTFTVIHTTEGAIRIEYGSKRFGVLTVNLNSHLADGLRDAHPDAFARPAQPPKTRKPWPTSSGASN